MISGGLNVDADLRQDRASRAHENYRVVAVIKIASTIHKMTIAIMVAKTPFLINQGNVQQPASFSK